MCVLVCICVGMCVYVCVCLCVYVCACVYMYVCVHVCVCVCLYIYLCICMSLHVCVSVCVWQGGGGGGGDSTFHRMSYHRDDPVGVGEASGCPLAALGVGRGKSLLVVASGQVGCALCPFQVLVLATGLLEILGPRGRMTVQLSTSLWPMCLSHQFCYSFS